MIILRLYKIYYLGVFRGKTKSREGWKGLEQEWGNREREREKGRLDVES